MAVGPVIVMGDLVQDILVELRAPVAYGTDTPSHIHLRAGGSGANQAAWICHLGVDTHFVARVGRDLTADLLAAELEQAGVTLHLSRDPERATGKIVILVDELGERSMFTDRGANLAFSAADLPVEVFQPGGHLHLSGYLFFDAGPREAARSALELARRQGMTTSVDPASVAFLEQVGAERFLEWTRGVDLCFPNYEEGSHLSGEEEPEAIAEALLAFYGGVALKLGGEGAIWAGEGGTLHLPAEPASPVDTTGAGDAFCAAFLAAWLGGADPARSLRRALVTAARAVGRIGGRPG